jgi:integrase
MPRTGKPKRRRRTRGEGWIGEKTINGVHYWVAAVRGVIDGKSARKYFYGTTAAEARQKRDTYLREKQVPTPQQDEDPTTVADYIKRFLAHTKGRARGTTHRSYEQVMRLHISPYIGAIRIKELADSDIRSMYATLERSKVSRSMAARCHTVLRACLNLALEEKVIEKSPLSTIRRAAPRYKRAAVQPLTADQVRKLLATARGHRLEAMLHVALDAGLREGEIIALRWTDVDLTAREIFVRRSAQEIDGEITFQAPKTDSGRRRIAISKVTTEALKRRQRLAAKEPKSELVFPDQRGGPQRKSNFIRRVWSVIREGAGLPTSVTFHTLRHTSASLLLVAGINPKIVQERLGHSSVRLTLDTYSHLLPGIQATAANAFDDLMKSKVRRAKSEDRR